MDVTYRVNITEKIDELHRQLGWMRAQNHLVDLIDWCDDEFGLDEWGVVDTYNAASEVIFHFYDASNAIQFKLRWL